MISFTVAPNILYIKFCVINQSSQVPDSENRNYGVPVQIFSHISTLTLYISTHENKCLHSFLRPLLFLYLAQGHYNPTPCAVNVIHSCSIIIQSVVTVTIPWETTSDWVMLIRPTLQFVLLLNMQMEESVNLQVVVKMNGLLEDRFCNMPHLIHKSI